MLLASGMRGWANLLHALRTSEARSTRSIHGHGRTRFRRNSDPPVTLTPYQPSSEPHTHRLSRRLSLWQLTLGLLQEEIPLLGKLLLLHRSVL